MRMNAEKTSGVAVQDVEAPVEEVLKQISNVEEYVGKVPGLTGVRNYARRSRGDGGVETKSTYVVSIAMGYKLEYYIDHVFIPKNRCLTWTLDYARKSDLEDSVGYWRVDELPGDQPRSRVFYSSSSLVHGMPQFVMDILTAQALKASTAWVKRYSEQSFQASGGRAREQIAARRDAGVQRKGLSPRCAFALANADISAASVVAECESAARPHVGAQPPGGDESADALRVRMLYAMVAAIPMVVFACGFKQRGASAAK